jgi:hypothetical protein
MMSPKRSRRALVIALAVAVVGVPAAATALAAVSGSAGSITAVRVVSDNGLQETSSRTFVDIPGAATTITVPPGQRGLIVARFSAASQCGSLNPDDDGCFVRILVGGVEAQPSSAGAFDMAACCPNSSNGDAFESHQIERSLDALAPGSYPVRVQWQADAENQFMLWGWHLTVERARVG